MYIIIQTWIKYNDFELVTIENIWNATDTGTLQLQGKTWSKLKLAIKSLRVHEQRISSMTRKNCSHGIIHDEIATEPVCVNDVYELHIYDVIANRECSLSQSDWIKARMETVHAPDTTTTLWGLSLSEPLISSGFNYYSFFTFYAL